jgi:hypothetical protein
LLAGICGQILKGVGEYCPRCLEQDIRNRRENKKELTEIGRKVQQSKWNKHLEDKNQSNT